MATFTINTTSAQDARLVVAFGTYLGLGRNATAAEIKHEIGNYLRLLVADQERNAAVKAATDAAVAALVDLGLPT